MPISIRLAVWMSRSADADSSGAIERGRATQHGGEADQAVEGGHQLRQGRHLDALRDEGADAPPITMPARIEP
jgi:hypothetical protein